MAEESDQAVVAALVAGILPQVPGVTEQLRAETDVLDIGCGSGHALNLLTAVFPRSRFVRYDFPEEGVTAAHCEAAERGVSNLRFEHRDVSEFDDVDRLDLITAFDAIHDQFQPERLLSGISRALRPGGTFLMQGIAGTSHVGQDAAYPVGTFLYTGSWMQCMTVSLADGGVGLGAMWGKEVATRMLHEAGFGNVDVRALTHDIINL